jgi:hypothetical protein
LVLAERLEPNDANQDRRVQLARRALRFGAGEDALQLLTSLDPEAAAELQPPDASAQPSPAPTPEA